MKQAEVGIAVANATDVAKASASLVLTNPGLTDTLAAVETSRRIYQRMLTYTLNKIIKTVEIGLFLSIGVILTRTFVITSAADRNAVVHQRLRDNVDCDRSRIRFTDARSLAHSEL